MSNKFKQWIRFLIAMFFLFSINFSRDLFTDAKLGLAFNLLCIAIALILFAVNIKSWSKEKKYPIPKRNMVIVSIGFIVGLILSIVLIYLAVSQM